MESMSLPSEPGLRDDQGIAGLHLDVLADVAVLDQIVQPDVDHRLFAVGIVPNDLARLPAAYFVSPLVAIITSSRVMWSR